MPAQVLTYFGGHKGVITGGSGTRITSTSPASQVVSGTDRHGMRVITSLSGDYPGGAGPNSQPYDARTDDLGGNGPITYDGGDNVNPGKTGVPLVITSPCSVIQALSKTDLPSERAFLHRRDVLHFVSSAPATDALPPPIGDAAGGSRYTKADLDLSAFPAHSPVSGGPSPSTLLNSIRWISNTEFTLRPPGDYYVGNDYEALYASDQARTYADVALALCSDIDATTREFIAAHVVIHAQNTVEVLKAGGRYNTNSGLGGILAGRKLFVVLAYIITGDSYFGDWAVRTDWAAEDMQVRRVDAAAVAAYDYEVTDEGMGDWNASWENATGSITRVVPKSYQAIWTTHGIAQALACMMVAGAKAAWNNEALFDYCDRIMERTLYDGSGTDKWARTLTGTNAPSAYHKAFWDAHRSDGGMPAIWNW